jgi:hypothetical protein
MLQKPINQLTDNEIDRLLVLRRGICIGVYGERDEVIDQLIDYGYIKYIEGSTYYYKFTDKGQSETEKYWDINSKIVLNEIKQNNTYKQTCQNISEKSGISMRIALEFMKDLNIDIKKLM